MSEIKGIRYENDECSKQMKALSNDNEGIKKEMIDME